MRNGTESMVGFGGDKMKNAVVFTVSLPAEMVNLINEYSALTDRKRSAVTQEIIALGLSVIANKYNEMQEKEKTNA